MREKIYVDEGSVGLGIFAKYPIEPREVIFYVTGPVVSFQECLRLPDEGENTFQIGTDSYVNPGFPGRFINHSCDPNAGLVDDTCVVAIRQINPGEEICFDYSTTMLERLWELDCFCASPKCRKKIKDFDLLPVEVQRRLLRLGIVQNYILEKIPSLDALIQDIPAVTSA